MKKVKEIVMEHVANFMTSTFGNDIVAKFAGKYTIIFAGETLVCVDPVFGNGQVMVFPSIEKSCGANGGGYIFNSGLGFSILSCDKELYRAINGKFDKHDAWVYCYNAGVNYDTPDQRIRRMEAACQVSDQAYEWMASMLGDKMADFSGLWVDITAGEKLIGVDPMISQSETMIFPKEEKSCGANGGGYIFNSGLGFSILSCDKELYRALNGKFDKHDAWVHAYNAGVWFDTSDKRIQQMEKLCGK